MKIVLETVQTATVHTYIIEDNKGKQYIYKCLIDKQTGLSTDEILRDKNTGNNIEDPSVLESILQFVNDEIGK